MTRIPRLDGLRAFAFIAVFLNHSVHLPMAWVGVDLFFVLSGFLITTILLRERAVPLRQYLAEFYERRARRILPAYILVLALAALLGLPEIDWGAIWWHFLTFLQNFSVAFGYSTGALTPYWSLAVEEQFYLVWPFIVFFVPRKSLLMICFGMLLGAPLLRAICTPYAESYTVIFCLTPFRMDLLAAGALIALIRGRSPDTLSRALPYAWGLLVLAGMAFFLPAALSPLWRASAHSMPFNTFGYSVGTLLFASVLVVVLGSSAAWLDVILEWKPLAQLGRISYMCYLIHEPALQFSWQFMSPAAGAAAAFAVTLLFAIASWRWIESPLLRSRPNVIAEGSSRTG